MTGHRYPYDAQKSGLFAQVADPGDAGRIKLFNKSSVLVPIVTAGASETRTMGDPDGYTQECVICHRTDGGDVTITFDNAIDEAGNTTVTLTDGGDAIGLKAINDSGNKRWRVAWADGAGGVTVSIAAATASKGQFTLDCADQDGNTTVTLKPAAMGQASVISIPDPGAATANVMLTNQANDGVRVTASATELNQIDGAILDDMATTAGTGITTGADNFASKVEKIGTLFKTTIVIDVDGLNSGANANDVIGKADTANCSLGQITAARNGTIFAGRMTCIETPAGGDDDIDLWDAESGTLTEDTDIEDDAGDEDQLTDGGDLTAGTVVSLTAYPTADRYLYLCAGTGDTNGTYTAGILVIELWGK